MKRTATEKGQKPRTRKPRLCKRGHDLDVVGLTGNDCRLCARERKREWARNKRATDPEFRARRNAESRERSRRYREDPEFRARKAQRCRERYENFSSVEYNQHLLQSRRSKALRRRAERDQRRQEAMS